VAVFSEKPIKTLLLHLALVTAVIVTLFPLAWMVAVSFMSSAEANRFPPPLLPESPTLEH
jgi:multiple sugar transport system permease protein